jgi:triphosphoribosyl-dephospho-CoA synthase
VYLAIRKVGPGGLGRAEEQDVAHEPTASLLEVMALAADRDDVAREYATGFATTFEVGFPAVVAARRDGLSWDDAVVETFLTVLAARPDTHIGRRAGASSALQVSAQARDVMTAGGVRSAAGRRRLDELDGALRERGSLLNPGTTADLTAAALFVMLASGGWPLPAER